MKMDRKLTILFSILMIVMTICNSAFAYNYNRSLLYENAYTVLYALGSKMLSETETYLRLMDYAIMELTSNIAFMNAMRSAVLEGEQWDEAAQLDMQQLMYQSLYADPLMENFYRVNVYSANGFFLSNHFEKSSSVSSMSQEARDIIASLPYLDQVNTSPSATHLIGPHPDPWTKSGSDVIIFSAVKAINWHGQTIGYIEVSASVEELMRIFSADEVEGVTAHALLDDGTEFFRFQGDDATYPNAREDRLTRCAVEDGSERFVIRLRNKPLELNVYVAQNMAVYQARFHRLLMETLAFGATILLVGIAITIVMSKGLTKSIRKLTGKIKQISSRRLVDASAELTLQSVTNPRDREIYTLEQVLNDLLQRLRRSAQREISMRNTTMQAQLNALQTQINPHFVYNTLNIISAKGMESGSEEIMELCDRFAQMLRYATDVQSRTATLAAEVANARHYLLLLKARYEDQLDFSIDIPQSAGDLNLPKLTLQPLIENAIKHGFRGQGGKKVIRIQGEIQGGRLYMLIRDNGRGFPQEVIDSLRAAFAQIDADPTAYASPDHSHIGLINTCLRLRFYSHGKIRIDLYNDHGAVVAINLPCERSDDHV